MALDAENHRTQSHLGVVAFRLWLQWLKVSFQKYNLACRTVALYLAGANPVLQAIAGNSHSVQTQDQEDGPKEEPHWQWFLVWYGMQLTSRPLGAEGKGKEPCKPC